MTRSRIACLVCLRLTCPQQTPTPLHAPCGKPAHGSAGRWPAPWRTRRAATWTIYDHRWKPLPCIAHTGLSTANPHRFPRSVWKTAVAAWIKNSHAMKALCCMACMHLSTESPHGFPRAVWKTRRHIRSVCEACLRPALPVPAVGFLPLAMNRQEVSRYPKKRRRPCLRP
jgi:hypothetical protein